MTLPIRIQIGEQEVIPPPDFPLYRQPHDIEMRRGDVKPSLDRVYMGDGHRSGTVRDSVTESGQTLPEVYRLLPDQQTPLSCAWITLWRNLNPALSMDTFCTLLDNHLAFTNSTGWPGRFNCLTGANQGEKDPAFHAPLICGGALLRGMESSGSLLIDSLLTSEPVPSAAWVMARPWLYFYGVQVAPSGNVTYINRLGTDSQLHPVIVPFVTRLQVFLPLPWLDQLPAGVVPSDARWMP